MEKKTNKAKLDIFKFLRKSALSQGSYDKIGGNYVLPANSIIICLLGYFCMQNSYLRRKQFKFLRFSGKMQKNREMNNFGNFSQFFEIFTETLEQNIRKSQKICFLDGKEDK